MVTTSPSRAFRPPSRSGALFSTTALFITVTLLGFCNGDEQPSTTECPTAFFNLGDSLSDTGNVVLAFPFLSDAENSPYGETFFNKPSGRFSNGRLVIDFLALAYKVPLLDPYFQSVGGNYVHGVNFAYAGATARPDNYFVPFFLGFQVAQFVRFKTMTIAAQQQFMGSYNQYLPDKSAFQTGLYTISIGGNDILASFLRQKQPQDIIQEVVPLMVQAIVSAVETLYLQDARKFLIFNIPPEGCSTVFLTQFENVDIPRDSLGCITAINEVDQVFNAELFKAVQDLRQSLPGVTITHFDNYAANVEILTNPSNYGFNPNLTTTACCGAPGTGTLNYNINVTCGHPGSKGCENPDEYMIWDGIHFTEALYRVIAKFVLTGAFSDPPTSMAATCNLSFDDFGNKTYDEVFPGNGLLLR